MIFKHSYYLHQVLTFVFRVNIKKIQKINILKMIELNVRKIFLRFVHIKIIKLEYLLTKMNVIFIKRKI